MVYWIGMEIHKLGVPLAMKYKATCPTTHPYYARPGSPIFAYGVAEHEVLDIDSYVPTSLFGGPTHRT